MPAHTQTLPRKNWLFLQSVIAIILFAIVFYLLFSQPRIAYVRNLEIVYGYNGMKQAHTEFTSQTSQWQSNIDTLRIRYQKSLSDYQQNMTRYSAKEKEEQKQLLLRMEADMKKYAGAVSEEAKDREAKLTEAVLTQINSFIETYAKEKGYDIVLGTEGNGTIVYGKQAYDITDEVLKELNASYKMVPVDSFKQARN